MRNCLTWHWLCFKICSMNHFDGITSGNELRLIGILVAVAVTVMALPTFASQSVKLTWSPSSSPDVVGYNIYYGGQATGGYTNEITVGNTTNTTVTGLVSGGTYFFSARAVSSSGFESTFAIQTSYVAPGLAAIIGKLVYSSNGVSMPVTGAPGSVYAIQASTDMVNWISLQTNMTPLQFTDTNADKYRKRFYRAVYLF